MTTTTPKKTGPSMARGTSKQDFQTPEDFMLAVKNRFGPIDFDLAAHEGNRQSKFYFNLEEDSFSRTWSDLRKIQWLNPICHCRIEPQVVEMKNGRKDVPELSDIISKNGGVLPSSEREREQVSLLVVQEMLRPTSAGETGETESGPRRKREIEGGEEAALPEPARTGMETTALHRGQFKSQTKALEGDRVELVYHALGENQSYVGSPVRILREEKIPDPGSLHPALKPKVPRYDSLEYGGLVHPVQQQQKQQAAAHMDERSLSICPHCGEISVASVSPVQCFLNPEFDDIDPWAEKCAKEMKLGARILFLTPASIGANWYWKHVSKNACVQALQSRMSFDGKHPYPKDLILSVFCHGLRGFQPWDWKGKRAR